MPSSSNWLGMLQRIREHRRDTALQSLARSLQAATQIRDATASVEAMISSLSHTQKPTGRIERLDSQRLRQLRQDRDDLRSRRSDLRHQQVAAEAVVHQAQANAATKDNEVEVLRRLQDRLDFTHRQAQQRRDEQSPLDAAVSLCNGGRSG